MAHDVIMPQMGESIAEGTITTWLKKVGEKVERDEPLFEISTDKVDAEIPSPASGILKEIKAAPGQTVPINSVVAVIAAEGEGATAQAPAQPAPAAKPVAEHSNGKHGTAVVAASVPVAASKPAAVAPAPQSVASAPVSHDAEAGHDGLTADERRRIKSSPVVRKIAAEHGVDVSRLQGSGISGRVTKSDILSHLERGPATAASPHVEMLDRPTAIPEAYRPRIMDGDRVEDLSPMRAKIAEHMVLSKRISSHVSAVFEVDFSRVAALRAKHKAVWAERHSTNLTYTSFIMKATVDALKAFPVMNASLDDKRVIYHRDINLGLAVALDWGLLVPVIHKADELNMLGLSRRAVDLAARARTKKLKPDEVQNGTFTITNPGIFGSLFGLPVINQPQAAIMGVGAVEKRPVVIDDMIAIRTRAYMSISFDHRLIDGAVADQFMSAVKKGIEEFDEGGM